MRRGPSRSVQARSWWATAVLASALLLSIWPLSQGVQVGVLLGGIAILGAPHGVFDIDLLVQASLGSHGRLIRLTAAYVACVALVLLGWRIAPGPTLVVFLACAIAHFGFEDGHAGTVRGAEAVLHVVARGGSVVAPLLLARSPVIAQVLAELTGAPPAAVALVLHTTAPTTGAVWLAAAAASFILHLRAGRQVAAAELLALVLLFIALPPLLAFAVYFTAVHAVGHVMHACRARAVLGLGPAVLWGLAWLAPAVAVSGAIVLRTAAAANATAATAETLRLLAALAVPHLLLGPWLERQAASRDVVAGCAHRSLSAAAGPRFVKAGAHHAPRSLSFSASSLGTASSASPASRSGGASWPER